MCLRRMRIRIRFVLYGFRNTGLVDDWTLGGRDTDRS